MQNHRYGSNLAYVRYSVWPTLKTSALAIFKRQKIQLKKSKFLVLLGKKHKMLRSGHTSLCSHIIIVWSQVEQGHQVRPQSLLLPVESCYHFPARATVPLQVVSSRQCALK